MREKGLANRGCLTRDFARPLRGRPFYNQLVSLFKKLPTEVALHRPSTRSKWLTRIENHCSAMTSGARRESRTSRRSGSGCNGGRFIAVDDRRSRRLADLINFVFSKPFHFYFYFLSSLKLPREFLAKFIYYIYLYYILIVFFFFKLDYLLTIGYFVINLFLRYKLCITKFSNK